MPILCTDPRNMDVERNVVDVWLIGFSFGTRGTWRAPAETAGRVTVFKWPADFWKLDSVLVPSRWSGARYGEHCGDPET